MPLYRLNPLTGELDMIGGKGHYIDGSVATPADLPVTVAVPATSMLTIYREVPLTQMTSYLEGGRFPSASQERAVDKLTMAAQQIARYQLASIRFREADGGAARLAKVVNTLMGISAGGNPVCRTADEVKSWLSLAAPILNYPTKTWADDAERALAVPDFAGQIGSQQDTRDLYVAHGNLAGEWTAYEAANIADGSVATTAKLADGIVNTSKLADATVTSVKLADDVGANAWRFLTASANALPGDRIAANTSAGGFTLTLPASPAAGYLITVRDSGRTWRANNLVVARNGETIEGLAEDMQCNVSGAEFRLFYTGSTWRVS